MFKNHLKIAWRSLVKNKGYSAIHIIGMAIGMAAVLLISVWVQNQFLYDNFYPNKEHIYKLWNRVDYQGDVNVHSITMAPAAKALKEEYPEVTYAARMCWSQDRLFSYKDKQIKSQGNEVDPDFLRIFEFPIRQGSPGELLDAPNKIVLTERLAHSLFGKEDPIGKILTMDTDRVYTVSGVIQDLPPYTDFDFSYLVQLTPEREKEIGSNWNTNTYFTFITLKPGAQVEALNKKIAPLVRNNQPELKWTSLFLYPMSKMHLYSHFENGEPAGGLIEQVRLVGGIGLLILLIACINFMNLSTARSRKRSKEIGVRKVVGADQSSLIGQFLSESVLVAGISGVLAVILSIVLLPWFNRLFDTPLHIDWSDPLLWIAGTGFVIFTGLLAGIYPAFVLSAFRPVRTLKGNAAKPIPIFNLREGLVVFQFAIAIFLIVATLIIWLQIQHAGQRNTGYQSAELIEIPVEGDISKNYEAIKATLLSRGLATQVTRTGWTITENKASAGGNFSWEGATPEQEKNSFFILGRTEGDFIKTLGLTLVEGRDIDYVHRPADSTAVLLNEAAVKSMGLDRPVGKYLKWSEDTYTIVGVFNDYISGSPYQDIQPMMIYAGSRYLQNLVIRSNPNRPMSENLKGIEAVLGEFNPSFPFNYRFVDAEYGAKFSEQQQMGALALIFSMLAIFISCLGLFGLASYTAEIRTKEIGIRKVLGASVESISMMLSRDFVKLVLIALCVAAPVAWWAMNRWLADFSYRIQMQWWMILLAGVAAIAIALLTVSWQAIRASMANPVQSLRDE